MRQRITKTVLVIDADKRWRESLKALIGAIDGVEMIEADGPTEGIELCNAYAVDFVLMERWSNFRHGDPKYAAAFFDKFGIPYRYLTTKCRRLNGSLWTGNTWSKSLLGPDLQRMVSAAVGATRDKSHCT